MPSDKRKELRNPETGASNNVVDHDMKALIIKSGDGSFHGNWKLNPVIYEFASVYNDILKAEEVIYTNKGFVTAGGQ